MSSTITRLSLVAAAAAVALGAGACSPAETGAAAVVGDRRVTTDQLQRALTDLRAGNPDFAQVQNLDRLVLFDLVAQPYLVKAARDAGLGVSAAEAQAALPQRPHADQSALDALQAQIALNKLSQAQKAQELAAVGAELRKAKVRVSPRYGSFDSKTLTIVDRQPNWLVPTPSPSPTATP